MKVILTNRGAHPVPITSTDDGGWSMQLAPGEPVTIDKPGSDLALIGDKPGHLENIAKGIQTIIDAITWFRRAKAERVGADEGALRVDVQNTGERALRIVPGNVENETELAPGSAPWPIITSDGYIELRELSGPPANYGQTPN